MKLNRRLYCSMIMALGVAQLSHADGPQLGRVFTVQENAKASLDWLTGYGPVDADGNVTLTADFRVLGPTTFSNDSMCYRSAGFTEAAYELEFSGTLSSHVFIETAGDGVTIPVITNGYIRVENASVIGKVFLRQSDLSILSREYTVQGLAESYDAGEDTWYPFFGVDVTIGANLKPSLGDMAGALFAGSTWNTNTRLCGYVRGTADLNDIPGAPFDLNRTITDGFARERDVSMDFSVLGLTDTAYAPGKSAQTVIIEGTDAGNNGVLQNFFSPVFNYQLKQQLAVDLGFASMVGESKVIDTVLYATGVDAASVTTAASGSSYSITFSSSNDSSYGTTLGTWSAGNYTKLQGSVPGAPMLARFQGTIPAFRCGDYLTITPEGSSAFRVYLPSNTSGQYGSDCSFWIESDGTAYFAKSGSVRSGMPNQTLPQAKSSVDLAASGGLRFTPLYSTANGNYNFLFNEFCNSAVTDTNSLRTLVNNQNGGGANKISTIARWNSISQTWQSYLYVVFGPPLNRVFTTGNFALQQGDILRLEVAANAGNLSLLLDGTKPLVGGLVYNLRQTATRSDNYLGIPSYRYDLTDAQKVSADVEAGSTARVSTLNQWNPVSQTFTQYIPALGGLPFPTGPGAALKLEASVAGPYVP